MSSPSCTHRPMLDRMPPPPLSLSFPPKPSSACSSDGSLPSFSFGPFSSPPSPPDSPHYLPRKPKTLHRQTPRQPLRLVIVPSTSFAKPPTDQLCAATARLEPACNVTSLGSSRFSRSPAPAPALAAPTPSRSRFFGPDEDEDEDEDDNSSDGSDSDGDRYGDEGHDAGTDADTDADTTMDKLPKFRRKPKPTIETAVERSSSDTVDSIASAEIQPGSNTQHQPQNQKAPIKLSKKTAFRNFRLRGSSKRARESPPVNLPTSPPPDVVSHDGIKSRPQTADPSTMANGQDGDAGVPPFLAPSMQDLDEKYQELVWAERERLLEAQQNESVEDYKWGTFKQLDMEEKGTMDRYVNIKPWNHNRVRLQVPEDQLGYVNASTVLVNPVFDPEQDPLQYIAMQGPTEPSFPYVWRMISEQLSTPAVIIQLTTMCEGGFVKCHQYFPTDEEQPTWTLNEDDVWDDGWQADLTVDSFEEVMDGAIEMRRLLLHVKGEEEPRVVWHLLYRKWPDFGVPELEDMEGFFELMRLSREHSAPSNPRVIHCSAGVGRTGTFIALEHLMRELDAGAFELHDEPATDTDPVYEVVNGLREQRMGMVQTKAQLHFIYQVMRKLWTDKYGLDEEGGEPAAKRLEVGDPFLDAGPGPDVGKEGHAYT